MKSLRRNLKSLQKPFVNGSSTLSPSATLIHEDGDRERVDEHGDLDGGDDDDWKGPIGLNLLHEPENPRVDLIFVHGLGGGSRKTWSLTKEMKHFWPKSWLPEDSAFENVRIYSFGYSSDWHKGKDSAMNIYDYGLSLLTAMELRPGFGADDAYMLARLNPQYDDIAKRISTFYFIATPHLGSDSAELLTKIFHAAYGSRSYVSDLERGSSTIRDINGQFRLYAGDLKLWSFYETLPLTVGFLSKIIVRQDFAVLGYGSEKQIPMTADHRSICKFNSVADPNYRNIRDALALTVRELTGSGQRLKAKRKYEQMKTLREYLGVASTPKEDLTIVQEARLSGTCEWLSSTASYIQWRNNPSSGPAIFWLGGNPGAGKSVLAGYAIEMLEAMDAEVSYFFFKFGDESKSKLNTCLRSIAFQMASRNESLKELLLSMHSDGIEFDKGDERTIWRKIFLSGIFQAPIPPQYWVIDALDECTDFVSFFGPMLAKLDNSIPIHILITSRPTAILQQQFYSLGTGRVVCEQISAADTLHDVRIFVEEKSMLLDVEPNDRDSLVERILAKSNDSFLWTAIVLSELLNVHGQEDINRVLEEVPQDMEPLYSRILETMSRAKHGKQLAQAILAWSICAQRPLTVPELESALNLDLSDIFLHFRRSIKDTCGQLVSIDGFGRVQIVHATAREFLVKNGLQSEFAINVEETHTRIAKTCLLYLTGPEMEPPPPRMRTSASLARKIRSEFAVYAIHSFSDHLAYSSPTADDVLDLLDAFLGKNILSWIQAVAENQDLTPMFNVSKKLSTYLDNLLRARPLGESRKQAIRGWSKDLIRIPTKFGDAMLSSPAAVHQVVFPFCPTESAAFRAVISDKEALSRGNLSTTERLKTYQFEARGTFWERMVGFFLAVLQYSVAVLSWPAWIYDIVFQSRPKESKVDQSTATRNNMLSIVGYSNTRWDELFCCIKFIGKSRATVIGHGDEHFAIGFNSGLIILYEAATYQQYRTLDHGLKSLKNLVFQRGTDLMASHSCSLWDCGTVRVWNIRSGEIIHQFEFIEVLFWLSFYKNSLLVVWRSGDCVSSWSLTDGSSQPDRPFDQLKREAVRRKRGGVSCMSMSPDRKTLAIAYHRAAGDKKSWPITLWDLEDDTNIGNCGKESDEMDVQCLLFNPDPNCELLAVHYNSQPDGELIILKPITNKILEMVPARMGVKCLSSSPDGHILLRACSDRHIVVHEFKTLTVLYFIKTGCFDYSSVSFGNDNFYFFECNELYCNVWEPAVLRQKRQPGVAWTKPSVESAVANGLLSICSMTVDPSGNFAFCGTNDASVLQYELETGSLVCPFYKLGENIVHAVGWWPKGEVLTAFHTKDYKNGWLTSTKLKKTAHWEKEGWEAERKGGFLVKLPHDEFGSCQLLISPDDGKCLFATTKRSYLVSVDGKIQFAKELSEIRWIQHPSSPAHIIGVEGVSGGRSIISIYSWSDLTPQAYVSFDTDLRPSATSPTDFYSICGNQMVVHLRNAGVNNLQHAYCFDWPFLKAESVSNNDIMPRMAPIALSETIHLVLGIWESRLIFCNKDGWVCSFPLENIHGTYQRHFFIPRDWINEGHALYAVTAVGDIVLCRQIELAIVKRGLEYVDRHENVVEALDMKPSSVSVNTLVEKETDNMAFVAIRLP
ncbi:NACHT and WD40 domain-containing protein [Histoplasma capsulatum H143]|uniref:NACHT and WD40 domain-containing protein n=1 Tax=Ajellomyces capsulatus (strain H143) TaxID=544712 RepID=C6H1C7_AJECH|nr:NACHT and WD40 domain-containing protein [Histoplasma capsulatum H143]